MSDKQKSVEAKKVTTPEFRVSFPAVFEPKAFQQQEAKFSVVMLFDKKKADLTGMKKAVFAAATERWGAKEKWPKNLRLPFRDGDEKEDMQGYEGCTFVTASSKQRPGLIDRDKSPIAKEDDNFYAGCYARATLIAFAYPKEGVKGISPGVSFSLQNIQKLRDGEPFSGRKKAEDEFDAVEDSEESSDAESTDDDMGF